LTVEKPLLLLALLADALPLLPLPPPLLQVLYTYVPLLSARHWSIGSVLDVDVPVQPAAVNALIVRPDEEHVTIAEPPLVVSRHVFWANAWPWQPLRQK
jgi:hypothetical protein